MFNETPRTWSPAVRLADGSVRHFAGGLTHAEALVRAEAEAAQIPDAVAVSILLEVD